MKEVNLQSLVQAFKNLDISQLRRYFNLFGISPKARELVDIESFINQLNQVHKSIGLLDGYFLGYEIPQIGKEFDLLRFGKDYVVNVELKSKNTGAKIYNQLVRNQYYLSFLDKPVYFYTYVSSEKQLYSLNSDKNLVQVDIKELYEKLDYQILEEVPNVDVLFDPSNYLVSPFNSTDVFMQGKYFLTHQQEDVKSQSLKLLNRKGETFISISGKAGTGKTLLTYDIAKEYIANGEKVLIIHCANLNSGQLILIDKYKWEISPIKRFREYKFSDYSLIILDEVQRIYPYQLDEIIKSIKKNKGNCIFSFDRNQCLNVDEKKNDIPKFIEDTTGSKLFQLTDKIRTNKEIASFIIALFDIKKPFENVSKENIELSYFLDNKEAKKYLNFLEEKDWKVINYTPDRIFNCKYEEYNINSAFSTHQVIGQEFDKVVAVIDGGFCYKGKDLTISHPTFYNQALMLFQIMTRTRKKLNLVIINNEVILDRCLEILGYPAEKKEVVEEVKA